MKIKQITYQHRRDFYAIYECEGCGHVSKELSGYDDRNYHDNVIPSMKCSKCNMSSVDLGSELVKTETRYPEGYQI